MAKLACKHCRYRFDSLSDKLPKKCPYCAREGTVKRESSAEDVVKEVSDIIGEAEQ